MSREIPQERIDEGDLTADEVIYLQDRNELPDHIEPVVLKYAEGGTYEDPLEDEEDDSTGPEDYLKGWNNHLRRTELSNRGLSDEGNKEELIARLLRSDAEELTKDDYPASDDEGEDEDED